MFSWHDTLLYGYMDIVWHDTLVYGYVDIVWHDTLVYGYTDLLSVLTTYAILVVTVQFGTI